MRLLVPTVLIILAGCSSTAPSDAAGSGSSGSERLTRVRAELRCTEPIPSGEAECASRGCSWQAPLFCSGVDVPDEERGDVTRECTCVCEQDLLECASVP